MSERTLKALKEAGFDYILGMRMRKVKELREAVLSRAGRYQVVSPNLEVKEVLQVGKRYIICFNPEEAKRESLVRQEELESLKLKSSGLKGLMGNSAYRKYLKLKENQAEIDLEKVKRKERYDGKYVLLTTTALKAEEVACTYKQLYRVECAFRELNIAWRSNLSITGPITASGVT